MPLQLLSADELAGMVPETEGCPFEQCVGGFTLGNPVVYEPLIDEHGADFQKAIGGAWFPSYDAAASALGPGGTLPVSWFRDRPADALPIAGRVYRLEGQCLLNPEGTEDEVGARHLQNSPQIVRCARP